MSYVHSPQWYLPSAVNSSMPVPCDTAKPDAHLQLFSTWMARSPEYIFSQPRLFPETRRSCFARQKRRRLFQLQARICKNSCRQTKIPVLGVNRNSTGRTSMALQRFSTASPAFTTRFLGTARCRTRVKRNSMGRTLMALRRFSTANPAITTRPRGTARCRNIKVCDNLHFCTCQPSRVARSLSQTSPPNSWKQFRPCER